MGIVGEIFDDENKPVLGLSKLIFVDFNTECSVDTFSSNDKSIKGLFPIYPVLNKCYASNRRGADGHTENSRNILPLKLCWA